jgi:hypothetical protein
VKQKGERQFGGGVRAVVIFFAAFFSSVVFNPAKPASIVPFGGFPWK